MSRSNRIAPLLRFGFVAASLSAAATAARAETTAPAPLPVLAVCSDPANLPYSNDRQQGFENRIASLLAADLHAVLRYTWLPERSNFFRRTLLDGACDVVISVPASLPIVATTRPYFTSSYVAVTRADAAAHFTSFDDPWLRQARIGLQQVGSEGYSTPPALSLMLRDIDRNITFFPMWAAAGQPDPQGRIVDAVAGGSIDVALVWGPFAGYFAKKHAAALRLEPILADPKQPAAGFVFRMAMGVRRNDTALRDRLQGAIDRHQAAIATILRDYGIPTVSPAATPATAVADKAGLPPPDHKSGG